MGFLFSESPAFSFGPEWVQYGVEGAIFFVGMVLLLAMMRIVDQRTKELSRHSVDQDKRAEAQDKRMTDILESISRNTVHTHTAEGEAADSETRKAISERLKDVMIKTGAARVYFSVYHNGVWTTNGLNLQKMSIYVEQINGVDVEPVMVQMQGLPRGFVPIFDRNENPGDFCDCPNIEEAKGSLDPMVYRWMEVHQVTGFIAKQVLDEKYHFPVGFVIAEFGVNHHSSLSDEEMRSEIGDLASKVGTIMNISQKGFPWKVIDKQHNGIADDLDSGKSEKAK